MHSRSDQQTFNVVTTRLTQCTVGVVFVINVMVNFALRELNGRVAPKTPLPPLLYAPSQDMITCTAMTAIGAVTTDQPAMIMAVQIAVWQPPEAVNAGHTLLKRSPLKIMQIRHNPDHHLQ